MKHLKDAEMHIERATYGNIDRSQFNALLAIAHALIAIAEHMDRAAEDAEAATERADLMQKKRSADRSPYGGY